MRIAAPRWRGPRLCSCATFKRQAQWVSGSAVHGLAKSSCAAGGVYKTVHHHPATATVMLLGAQSSLSLSDQVTLLRDGGLLHVTIGSETRPGSGVGWDDGWMDGS